MKLHEAIAKLLKETGRQMTTSEIANALNKNKWYAKKDGSLITTFQIHGRTKNYADIFSRDGSMVFLNGEPIIVAKVPIEKIKKDSVVVEIKDDHGHHETILMKEENFKSAATIDKFIPDEPGIYCIRIKDISYLPEPFNNLIKVRNHNIMYIGIASKSLRKRFLNQELRANGHGTFFRSIGAILGYRPVQGSLLTKANKRNYKFSSENDRKIIEWINANLFVNWVEIKGDFEVIETGMIQRHLPLLNLAKNPLALNELSILRAECVRIACS